MCSDFYRLSLPIRIHALITWFDNFNGNMVAVGNVFFWDDEKEAKLVELWQKNDCLYETTSEGYKDRG